MDSDSEDDNVEVETEDDFFDTNEDVPHTRRHEPLSKCGDRWVWKRSCLYVWEYEHTHVHAYSYMHAHAVCSCTPMQGHTLLCGVDKIRFLVSETDCWMCKTFLDVKKIPWYCWCDFVPKKCSSGLNLSRCNFHYWVILFQCHQTTQQKCKLWNNFHENLERGMCTVMVNLEDKFHVTWCFCLYFSQHGLRVTAAELVWIGCVIVCDGQF